MKTKKKTLLFTALLIAGFILWTLYTGEYIGVPGTTTLEDNPIRFIIFIAIACLGAAAVFKAAFRGNDADKDENDNPDKEKNE